MTNESVQVKEVLLDRIEVRDSGLAHDEAGMYDGERLR